MAGLHMKECFVVLERLDEKSLWKCLQNKRFPIFMAAVVFYRKAKKLLRGFRKNEPGTTQLFQIYKWHGLKLASSISVERPMTDRRNNCQTRSVSKKAKQKKRKKRNSDDFILEKNRKRKKRKIKPLCYTDDESCGENDEIPTKVKVASQVLSESADNSASSNKFDKMPVQSEPEEISCDKISATAESTTVSSVSEIREELVEDGKKSESQLKNEVRPQHEDVCCGRTNNREIPSSVDNDIEIIKVCEKPCDKKQLATPLSSKKSELIVDTESVQLSELEDDGYDSREDSEDERKTVIFEAEFQKGMDLEELIELEGKEMSKKFNNREITNRKRQRLVKFKRKSMSGRNLAKIERKPKSKILEGSGSGQETPEKSSECVSEECLKEVCGLVKRLHELSRIIALLQRELPKNEEMSVHFNRVINAQQENFHREIRKGQKTIIKCYEKMLNFYSETSQVALEIGKRTSLSVEDVVNVISLCILVEGRCEAEKSGNVGKPGIFPAGTSPEGLKKVISDNFMKVIKKKISQMEGFGSIGKEPRLQDKISSSFAFSTPQSNHQNYQKVNHTTQQTKHKKNCSLLPLQPQQAVGNFTSSHPQLPNTAKQKLSSGNFFPSSRTNSEQQNVTKSPGSSLSGPDSQKIINNINGFPTSQRDIPDKQKEVSSTAFSLSQTDVQPSQETRYSFTGFPPLTNTQSNITPPSLQSNTRKSVIRTNFLPSESSISKTSNQPYSQPDNKNTSSGPSKPKKKTNVKNCTQQIVKNPTGSRSNIPSRDVNQHPALLNQPSDKPFRPQTREKAVHPSGREVMPSEKPRNNLEIPERQRPNRTPQTCVLTPGLGQSGINKTIPLPLFKTVSQRPMGNQPAAASGVMYRGPPSQNVRTSNASTQLVNHPVSAFPQRNTLPVPSTNRATPAAVFLLTSTEDKSNENPTCRRVGGLRSSEFPSVTTSKSPADSTKQATRPSTEKCPRNTPNFMVSIRMLDNCQLLKTHVELHPRNCTATLAVKNFQNGVEQRVLDPTVPQKLTMKNSRLQAGPFLNVETDGAEIGEKSIHSSTKTKNVCNELGNSDREKSQSRVYVCAKDDCRNPGLRICKGCHSIIYCSAACQFKHWVQTHKAECYQLKALRE